MIRYVKKIFRKSAFARKLYSQFLFLFSIAKHDLLNIERALLFLRVMPYTMVGYACVRNVYDLALDAFQNGREGAFVECGVWKGGAAGVLGFVAEKEKKARQVWLFDSFEGLPEPSSRDGEAARSYASGKDSGQLSSIGKCVGPLEDVRKLFLSVLKLKGSNIHIEKGWFQDTLPRAKPAIGPIAILRLDADWYESTKCALENLYDLVVPQGYIIVDDYGHWEGCRKAIDEFFQSRRLTLEKYPIDGMAVYFKKP